MFSSYTKQVRNIWEAAHNQNTPEDFFGVIVDMMELEYLREDDETGLPKGPGWDGKLWIDTKLNGLYLGDSKRDRVLGYLQAFRSVEIHKMGKVFTVEYIGKDYTPDSYPLGFGGGGSGGTTPAYLYFRCLDGKRPRNA